MPQPSRRAVLRAGVVAAAVVAAPGLTGQAQALSGRSAPTRLRRGEFVPNVGTTFRLVDGSRSYRAKLVSVDDHDRGKGDEKRFSLTFETRGMPPEGIYSVRHATMRTFDLFVAPVTRKPGVYEAVVSS